MTLGLYQYLRDLAPKTRTYAGNGNNKVVPGAAPNCPTCLRLYGLTSPQAFADLLEVEGEPDPFTGGDPCDLCGAPPGLRVTAHAEDRETGRLVHLVICADCAAYFANGTPPTDVDLTFERCWTAPINPDAWGVWWEGKRFPDGRGILFVEVARSPAPPDPALVQDVLNNAGGDPVEKVRHGDAWILKTWHDSPERKALIAARVIRRWRQGWRRGVNSMYKHHPELATITT